MTLAMYNTTNKEILKYEVKKKLRYNEYYDTQDTFDNLYNNRGTKHALANIYKKINRDKIYHVINIDIKSFFDNVNHGKLLKQLWTLGIKDKRIISIISKMLKAEIEGIGIPTKVIPQGGILSSLLANVVLNEFDWWISDQWLTFETRHDFGINGNKYRHLRTTKLKEIYPIRYADDFLIFCKDKETANKTFYAIKDWLDKRLNLTINDEKSEIVDIRKKGINYLGFKIKAFKKSNKWIVKSHVSEKATKKIIYEYKKQVKCIQNKPTNYNIYNLNRYIVGLHNYYKPATEVSLDFKNINYKILNFNKHHFRDISSKNGYLTYEYYKRYSKYNNKKIFVNKCIIYPLNGIKTKPPMLFSNDINNYTINGRNKIHKKVGYIDNDLLNYYVTHPVEHKSVEYNDNRLSLYT